MEEIQDIVTDEMLDAAQNAVTDVYRVDAYRIIHAALQVMLNDDLHCECPNCKEIFTIKPDGSTDALIGG